MTPNRFLHLPINESLWGAIRDRRDSTGESITQVVESALRETLDLEGDAAFQTSTIGAVLEGVYHGDITVGESWTSDRGNSSSRTVDASQFCLKMTEAPRPAV